jgi:hypothetical protein
VDAPKKTMSFQTEGAFSPNMMGRELTRSFELTGDRLTVTYGDGQHYAPAGTKWTFERVPTADNALAPTYRKVIGFWQHVVEKRVNVSTGVALSETRRAPSIIVYTPSGYVGVHFPSLNRQKFAADAPTDAEARAALSGYVGYFGALSVYPNMVFHQILGGVSMTPGTTLKRPLDLSGDDVTIKFPVNPNQQGQQTTTWVIAPPPEWREGCDPTRPAEDDAVRALRQGFHFLPDHQLAASGGSRRSAGCSRADGLVPSLCRRGTRT